MDLMRSLQQERTEIDCADIRKPPRKACNRPISVIFILSATHGRMRLHAELECAEAGVQDQQRDALPAGELAPGQRGYRQQQHHQQH